MMKLSGILLLSLLILCGCTGLIASCHTASDTESAGILRIQGICRACGSISECKAFRYLAEASHLWNPGPIQIAFAQNTTAYGNTTNESNAQDNTTQNAAQMPANINESQNVSTFDNTSSISDDNTTIDANTTIDINVSDNATSYASPTEAVPTHSPTILPTAKITYKQEPNFSELYGDFIEQMKKDANTGIMRGVAAVICIVITALTLPALLFPEKWRDILWVALEDAKTYRRIGMIFLIVGLDLIIYTMRLMPAVIVIAITTGFVSLMMAMLFLNPYTFRQLIAGWIEDPVAKHRRAVSFVISAISALTLILILAGVI